MAVTGTTRIASVEGAAPGEVDTLLADVAIKLRATGLVVAGTVQRNIEIPDRRCGMELVVLPSETRFGISEDRGRFSRGCRLDAAGLSAAVQALEQDMRHPFDVFILNKFGAREFEGAGFRSALAEAVMTDTPALVGVNSAKRKALEAFVEQPVLSLRPTPEAVVDWVARAHRGSE